MTASYSFYFAQPWWLLALVLLAPVIWLAQRSLNTLGRVRRTMAIVLRCLVIIILVMLLARPMLSQKNEQLTVIAVIDRSQSIPDPLQQASLAYLARALANKPSADRLAVVDIAEVASISKLPSTDIEIRRRNPTLMGLASRLADGIQMAMAIAPPDTAARILLVSEGNQTDGDLKEAARLAAANRIPVDVLPLRYQYEREVVFRRLAGPSKARSGQTVSLRFILNSTAPARGKIFLNLNDKPVDLAPDSPEIGVPVELEPGTNVRTVSVPVGRRGMHEFEAVFIPDDSEQDKISQNNMASAMTYVAGPGHVLVVDSDGSVAPILNKALQNSDIEVRYTPAAELPDNLARLMDTDAVIMANTDISNFTYQQQEMLCRYVSDIGGGLIMVGGPQAFGAGGWIGSPVAQILPVDLDPPQKKQLPKGALVLIMHACEMPQGNFWGKKVAEAAVKTLSSLDLAGILAYSWQGAGDWVYPLSPVGDKKAVLSAINQMQMGDMPSLHDHLQAAYNALKDCDAAQKHVIVISDGDPQPPSQQLLTRCRQAQITVTGVGIFPHSPADVQSLYSVSQATGGRFYNVTNPQQLPQIFIKEAQVVRRSLIVEETFSPQITYSLSEITRGLNPPLPNLDGYVLTGPKGGLSQIILSSNQADPVLAACQSGLGRCVAFTSSVDSRWASNWLQWPGFETFWEQTVRWAAKPAQASDCEVFADVEGRKVTVNVEALDAEGRFLQLANIDGQIIAPDMSNEALGLTQIGPGQYRAQFQADASGSYVVNLRYRKLGEDAETHLTQTTVTIPFAPEFRDLSDNAPLLNEVSQITGGNILSADPNQANLFDYTGVKFPETQLPLNRHLMLAWLVLFLSDVAVRRVAVDFKAGAQWVAAFVRSLRTDLKADQTLERLRLRRDKLREQLVARSTDQFASKRYEAPAESRADLPMADTKPTEPPRQKKVGEPTEERPAPAEQPSHIQQLLRAKRQAAERRMEEEPENNE
ncbi:MAG TPA: VWA domain-containing protein [Sedimentisphaerales bacterium]|nr:VWA domain-containing protein [Sedimentisphaerales bacterium]